MTRDEAKQLKRGDLVKIRPDLARFVVSDGEANEVDRVDDDGTVHVTMPIIGSGGCASVTEPFDPKDLARA